MDVRCKYPKLIIFNLFPISRRTVNKIKLGDILRGGIIGNKKKIDKNIKAVLFFTVFYTVHSKMCFLNNININNLS